jgi:hypothetical protein
VSRDIIDQYTLLLIKQYWEKTRAKAEIEHMMTGWQRIADLMRSFEVEFDLDTARGRQLDVLGKIAGVPRVVPAVLPRVRFGFDQNPNSRGFADRFNLLRESAPFADRFEPLFTSQQLDDPQYRQLIRVKVAKNICAAVMTSDERISIQDVIVSAFTGRAYVVDNQDMTLTLYVSPSVSLDELRLIRQLDLLPKPQAVRYKFVVQAEPSVTFGFSSNPNSIGFADRFDSTRQGGIFARKVING